MLAYALKGLAYVGWMSAFRITSGHMAGGNVQALVQASEARAVQEHRPMKYWIERVESVDGPGVAIHGDIVLVRRTNNYAADRARAFASLKRKGLLSCDCCGVV